MVTVKLLAMHRRRANPLGTAVAIQMLIKAKLSGAVLRSHQSCPSKLFSDEHHHACCAGEHPAPSTGIFAVSSSLKNPFARSKSHILQPDKGRQGRRQACAPQRCAPWLVCSSARAVLSGMGMVITVLRANSLASKVLLTLTFTSSRVRPISLMTGITLKGCFMLSWHLRRARDMHTRLEESLPDGCRGLPEIKAARLQGCRTGQRASMTPARCSGNLSSKIPLLQFGLHHACLCPVHTHVTHLLTSPA